MTMTPEQDRSNEQHPREWGRMMRFFRRAKARMRAPDAARRFPVDRGWQTLQSRMQQDEEFALSAGMGTEGKPRRAVIRQMRTRWVYAAAIVLVIVLGAGYWWKEHLRRTSEATVLQHVPPTETANLPPARKVRLIMAGGRQVPLDSSFELRERNGVGIHVQKEGLAYDGSARSPQTAPSTVEVLYDTLEVPRGNTSRLVLADGTKVWVNAESRLIYPTTFSGTSRKVIIEGEAYFEVSRDPNRPFIVNAKGMDIHVLGTAFNVNTYSSRLLTTLTEGRVSVSQGVGGAGLLLTAGEQGMADPLTNRMRKEKVETYLYTAWKDGVLYLDNASLQDISTLLGRHYDYHISFDDSTMSRLHFSVDLHLTLNLQDMLDYITKTSPGLKVQVQGREVRIFR